MLKNSLIFGLLSILLLSCTPQESTDISPAAGKWRGVLTLEEGVTLPFFFTWNTAEGGKATMEVLNDQERLLVDEIVQRGDSLFIDMPIFNSAFVLHLRSETEMQGYWANRARGEDYQLAFTASHNPTSLFDGAEGAVSTEVAPRYAVDFDEGEDQFPAVGVFKQEGASLQGTFMTETGDYRYLDGQAANGQLSLSTFDGAHAFLFTAQQDSTGTLQGTFYSGNHYKVAWTGTPNPEAELRAPEDLTYLKEGYDRFDFAFPNLEGDTVRLDDPLFQGKVVIVQIMGSWCPNCMDESQLYSDWYKTYKSQGLEIVGLGFEGTPTTEQALNNLRRLKERLAIDYTLLLASNSRSKLDAAETLPQLNHVMSFPTSIFIDREGQVRRIHTGFNGPGTGDVYTRYVEEYQAFIEKMLGEIDPSTVAQK